MNLKLAASCVAMMLVTAPASADTHSRTLTFLLVRTTSGASHFNLDLAVNSPPSGAYIGTVDGVVSHGRVSRVLGGSLTGVRTEADGVDAGPLHVRMCNAVRCHGAPNGVVFSVISYRANNSKGDVNALFIVLKGVDPTYEFHGAGWRLLPVPLKFRTVDSWDNAPAQATLGADGAAVVTGAQAPGGPSGSVAIAQPPCSIATVGVVSHGVGQVRLVGGETAPTFTCPIDRNPIGSYSNHSTTWRVQGFAAGDSTLASTTLFVIDQPAQLPRVAR